MQADEFLKQFKAISIRFDAASGELYRTSTLRILKQRRLFREMRQAIMEMDFLGKKGLATVKLKELLRERQ